jgi:hypothetical protein
MNHILINELLKGREFFDVLSLNPDIYLDTKIDGIDNYATVSSIIDKSANAINFTAVATANNLRYDSISDTVLPILSTGGLRATLPAYLQSVNYLEVYAVITPFLLSFTTDRILLGFRSETQQLIQLAMRASDRNLLLQVRTNSGAIQIIAMQLSVKRFNVVKFIIDKTLNTISLTVDGVTSSIAYTFGTQTIVSSFLSFLNLSSPGNYENSSLLQCGEFIWFASNTLTPINRVNLENYLNRKYNEENKYIKQDRQVLSDYLAETPVVTDYFNRADIYYLVNNNIISVIDINVGDDPQIAFDNAEPGSLLRFKSGTHTLAPDKHRAILYCDKPMYIEIEAGAIVKLANNSNTLDRFGEIVVNQGSSMVLDDFEIRGVYNGIGTANLDVTIDGVSNPNTFKWGINSGWPVTFTSFNVPITGNWQSIGSTGLEIRFGSTTGHAIDNKWIVCFDGEESYGIRIGRGFHNQYIQDIVMFGDGIIDMNDANQIPISVHAKNLPSCILAHGRVRNVTVEGITLTNCHRTVMAYGDSDGAYLPNGVVSGGTDYECNNITIINTTHNNDFLTGSVGYGVLIGHPEHRGGIRNVSIVLNTVITRGTGIEPNFCLRGYELRNNYIRSSGSFDIHPWRESANGFIVNNNSSIQSDSAPSGWQLPRNVFKSNNIRS